MKLIIPFLFFFTTAFYCRAQSGTDNPVVSVNVEKVMQWRDTSTRCLLVKFWIPNCPTAKQQFKEYMDFAAKKTDMDIVFVGITNIPQKITDIATANGYHGTLYMLDTTIHSDIYKRFEIFQDQMGQRFKSRVREFDTLILSPKKGKGTGVVLKLQVLGFPEKKLKCI